MAIEINLSPGASITLTNKGSTMSTTTIYKSSHTSAPAIKSSSSSYSSYAPSSSSSSSSSYSSYAPSSYSSRSYGSSGSGSVLTKSSYGSSTDGYYYLGNGQYRR
ncbi:uncharacterized protein EHS24_003335 [Apiotrichum porosum]|uniref:Uncharacterized protein n=1 Tax=Apiotrichum porosum TaxID=105984 RepID=A0A427XET8_9TREE|nr:uncharacterized protein EHS24_003335 [Apiotrichum porosum]RSH77375.1 hypothetical protein EHS24_003335 [Apiotrichum porosum]